MSQSTVNLSLHSSFRSQTTLWVVLLVSVFVHGVVIFAWPPNEVIPVVLEPTSLSISIASRSLEGGQIDRPSDKPAPVLQTTESNQPMLVEQNFAGQLTSNTSNQQEVVTTVVTPDEPSRASPTVIPNAANEPKALLSEFEPVQAVSEQTPPPPASRPQHLNDLSPPIIDASVDTTNDVSENQVEVAQSDTNEVVPDMPVMTSELSALPPSSDSDYVQAQFKNGTPVVEKPELAAKRRWKGTVILRGRVGLEGELDRLSVYQSSGYDVLDEAAVTQAQQWLFEPALLEQTPIVHWVQIPVVFR